MKNIFIKRTLRRTIEYIVPCVFLSAIVTWLNVIGFLPTRQLTLSALCIGAAIYLFLNIRFSRNSAFRNRNLPLYYGVNYIALAFFSLIILLVYKVFGNVPFTWMFAIVKVAVYTTFNIPEILAVAFFLFVIFVIVTISPLGMNFIVMYHDEDEDNV